MSPSLRPALALALALALCACLRPAGANAAFFSCLGPGTPAAAPGGPGFADLVRRNFRNDGLVPRAVVAAASVAHVADAVRCAAAARLQVCARSGGHSLAGKSQCAGVLVDVGRMRSVTVGAGGEVATVQAGANMGETLWALWQRRRWLAAGVCPGVGVAGYTLGGGHGPYEGRLGLACDALVDVTMVDRAGKVVVASPWQNKELFWGLCGAGGGQFGVVTSFRTRTASSAPFDAGVVFHVTWPAAVAGEVLAGWHGYGEEGGDVWFRMEVQHGDVLHGYGACYNVGSAGACRARLEKNAWFRTAGLQVRVMQKVTNALDLHAFFGEEGGWGRYRAGNLRKALLQQAYVDSGKANGRSYQSTFLRGGARPGRKFWQAWADRCRTRRGSVPWAVCEINLFNNAIDKPRNNAFAHRGADVITHYIIGGGSSADRSADYNWMKAHLQPYTSGVYVNYPELELGNYAGLYWGGSLARLKALKKAWDPDMLFANPQPIPT